MIINSKKETKTVSIVVPTLNEEDNIINLLDQLKPFNNNLIDEIIVVDSGSTDETVKKVKKADFNIFETKKIYPKLKPIVGKGEALWRSLFVVNTDIVIFLDADLINPINEYIPKLLQPFISSDKIKLVKGYYFREIHSNFSDDFNILNSGGRVNNLVARPLLSLFYPELSGVIQPLGGEYAADTTFLKKIKFPVDYSVDISILIDCLIKNGIESIEQVDLGLKKHRNRNLSDLSKMSWQIMFRIFNKLDFPLKSHEYTNFYYLNDIDEDFILKSEIIIFELKEKKS